MCRALITSLLLLAIASPALAFQPMQAANGNPICWHDSRIALVLDSEGSSELGQNGIEQSVVAAIRAWDQIPATDLRLEFAGQAVVDNLGYTAEGNVHAISFFDQQWPFSPGALAVTLSAWETETGRLVDADIAVNTYEYDWSVDGAAGRYDLPSALTHELGHLVGLAHATDVNAATMYPSMPTGDTSKRDLHTDDIAGFQFLYGNGETVTPPTQPVGGHEPELDGSSPAPGVVGPDGSSDPAAARAPAPGTEPVAEAAQMSIGCSVHGGGPAELSPVLLALGALFVTGVARRRATRA